MAEMVVLDPGHGGADPGAVGPTGLREAEVVLDIAKHVFNYLKAHNISVTLTRTKSAEAPSLSERAEMANAIGAELFVSIHCNGHSSDAANGIETYHFPDSAKGKELAKSIQSELIKALKFRDRGVKTAMFAVLRLTRMPAALAEVGFITNPGEEMLLKRDWIRKRAAEAVARGILQYLGLADKEGEEEKPIFIVTGTPILGPVQATVEQAKAWARSRGATEQFVALADLYWDLAPETSVRPEVAYAQSAKETGFGHFGGVLTPQHCNPCGLKVTSGGNNNDPDAHQQFETWREGVQAHLDHLALYAGANGYPKVNTPDPRHFTWLCGRAPNVEALGGKWAPSPDYGSSIVNRYLRPLLATPEPQAPEAKADKLEQEVKKLEDEVETLKRKLEKLEEENRDMRFTLRQIATFSAPYMAK